MRDIATRDTHTHTIYKHGGKAGKAGAEVECSELGLEQSVLLEQGVRARAGCMYT